MVELREGDIPVQVPPASAVEEVTMDEHPVEFASVAASDHEVDAGGILPEAVDVLDSQEAIPTIGRCKRRRHLHLLIVPWILMHDKESGEIRDNRELMREMNNFVERVSLQQNLPASHAVGRDTPESSTHVPEPTLPSGPSSGPQPDAQQEAVGPQNIWDGAVAATDDIGTGLPMNVAIGVPFEERSPSPEALERNQPDRKGKKKVDEGAVADMDRKDKRKVDEQPSTLPPKKNKRIDVSDEDSNESNHAKGEAVQYTHFAALGNSEREKRRWGYIDKFINETVQDKIEKRERELRSRLKHLKQRIPTRPSSDPLEISSDHDDKKGTETIEPTAAPIALGSTKRIAKKPRKRSARKPAPPENPWITLSSSVRASIKPKQMVHGDVINTFMEAVFSQLPPSMTGC
ncbi:hypothetical protein R1sor_000178 [Riccia sorocarpa]|uniref:Uncharacterized protein n=1 Tax=Riccia sorocarpa TaxID=122646 RepID=A0ABD3GUB6_9MARC